MERDLRTDVTAEASRPEEHAPCGSRAPDSAVSEKVCYLPPHQLSPQILAILDGRTPEDAWQALFDKAQTALLENNREAHVDLLAKTSLIAASFFPSPDERQAKANFLMAAAFEQEGYFEDALPLYMSAAETFSDLKGGLAGLIISYRGVGYCLYKADRVREAILVYSEVEGIINRCKERNPNAWEANQPVLFHCLFYRGLSACHINDLQQAEDAFSAAVEFLERFPGVVPDNVKHNILSLRAKVRHADGNVDGAVADVTAVVEGGGLNTLLTHLNQVPPHKHMSGGNPGLN